MTWLSCSAHDEWGDRYRDIDEEIRARVLRSLQVRQAAPHYRQLVSEGGRLAGEEAAQVLGDSLPLGLSLRG
jgi:hypothetical protein